MVDDCSDPENRAKLAELTDLATIVHAPRKLGNSAARNLGASLAKGDWISFLDDDDLLLPTKIEAQVKYLACNPECVALGGRAIMRPPDGPEEYWGGKVTRRLALADALYYTASLQGALLIRKDVYLGLSGFDEGLNFLEDYDLGIRIVSSGFEMHHLAEPLFIYNLGGRSQLSLKWGKMLRAEFRILWRHRKLCREAFGRLGCARMLARACRVKGIRRGRVVGRFMWLIGSMSDKLIGLERGEYY